MMAPEATKRNLPLILSVVGFGIILLVGSFLPIYPRFVLSMILVNVIAILGLNLVMGYAGQVSLGQAGFAAIGAYTTILLVVKAGVSYWPALAIASIGSAVVGLLVGVPAIRLQHLYLAMATWSFGVGVTLILVNWHTLTRGPYGVLMAPPTFFGTPLDSNKFFYVVATAAVLLWISVQRIVQSRLGRAFMAVRESEVAARSAGINIVKYKTLAFTLSAFYGGISGGLYVGLTQFAHPDAFLWHQSIHWVTMNVVGGHGTLVGPLLGGTLLTILPEMFGSFDRYAEVVSGALLLMFLVFLPRGIVGLVSSAANRFSNKESVDRKADLAAGVD